MTGSRCPPASPACGRSRGGATCRSTTTSDWTSSTSRTGPWVTTSTSWRRRFPPCSPGEEPSSRAFPGASVSGFSVSLPADPRRPAGFPDLDTRDSTVKTYAPRARDIERRWYVIDADGAILGRLASEVAKLLRGKHKPIFAPHADTGDHVIVINARGVRLSGSKLEGKLYQHHSGYPGGLKTVSYDRLMSERPTMVVEKAVRGMLPKNRLGRKMIGKLSVYEGAEHPHAAQLPVPLGLGEIPAWTGLPAPPEPKPAPEPK